LRRFWGGTRGREERRQGRSAQGLYRRGYAWERLGFRRGQRSNGSGLCRARGGLCSEEGAMLTWGPEWRTLSGFCPGGSWAGSWPGPDSVPGALFSLPIFFLFSLFWKLFYFITFSFVLQFDSNQFVKFSKKNKTTLQNSKKTIFQNKVIFLRKTL
jgi:hypothetical protein